MRKFWMVIAEALAEARRIEDTFWTAGPRRQLAVIRIKEREGRDVVRRAA